MLNPVWKSSPFPTPLDHCNKKRRNVDTRTLCLAVFISASYGAWPNLAKPLQVKPGIVTFVIIVVALLVLIIRSPEEISAIATIPGKALVIITLAALANGLAICFYADTAANKNIQTGTFLVTIYILNILFAPAFDWLATGTRPCNSQYLGLALAVPVIYLLNQRPQ